MSKFVVSAAAFFRPVLVAMLLAGCASKVPTDLPPGTALYYTDICYHEMTGDVLGFRLTLTKSSEGYAAKLLSISGEPPGSTINGTATVNGSALAVDLMEGTKPVAFKGTLTTEEITGRFVYATGLTSGGSDFHWKRVAANEMSLGACR